jgi:hypothetical protein
MAGSRRWFSYETDSGIQFNVELDESNAESANLGFSAIVSGAPAIKVTAKRPVEMRRVYATAVAAPNERRSFPVGSLTAMAAIVASGSLTVGGDAYTVTGYAGERVSIVPDRDTGLTDGDIDLN